MIAHLDNIKTVEFDTVTEKIILFDLGFLCSQVSLKKSYKRSIGFNNHGVGPYLGLLLAERHYAKQALKQCK